MVQGPASELWPEMNYPLNEPLLNGSVALVEKSQAAPNTEQEIETK